MVQVTESPSVATGRETAEASPSLARTGKFLPGVCFNNRLEEAMRRQEESRYDRAGEPGRRWMAGNSRSKGTGESRGETGPHKRETAMTSPDDAGSSAPVENDNAGSASCSSIPVSNPDGTECDANASIPGLGGAFCKIDRSGAALGSVEPLHFAIMPAEGLPEEEREIEDSVQQGEKEGIKGGKRPAGREKAGDRVLVGDENTDAASPNLLARLETGPAGLETGIPGYFSGESSSKPDTNRIYRALPSSTTGIPGGGRLNRSIIPVLSDGIDSRLSLSGACYGSSRQPGWKQENLTPSGSGHAVFQPDVTSGPGISSEARPLSHPAIAAGFQVATEGERMVAAAKHQANLVSPLLARLAGIYEGEGVKAGSFGYAAALTDDTVNFSFPSRSVATGAQSGEVVVSGSQSGGDTQVEAAGLVSQMVESLSAEAYTVAENGAINRVGREGLSVRETTGQEVGYRHQLAGATGTPDQAALSSPSGDKVSTEKTASPGTFQRTGVLPTANAGTSHTIRDDVTGGSQVVRWPGGSGGVTGVETTWTRHRGTDAGPELGNLPEKKPVTFERQRMGAIENQTGWSAAEGVLTRMAGQERFHQWSKARWQAGENAGAVSRPREKSELTRLNKVEIVVTSQNTEKQGHPGRLATENSADSNREGQVLDLVTAPATDTGEEKTATRQLLQQAPGSEYGGPGRPNAQQETAVQQQLPVDRSPEYSPGDEKQEIGAKEASGDLLGKKAGRAKNRAGNENPRINPDKAGPSGTLRGLERVPGQTEVKVISSAEQSGNPPASRVTGSAPEASRESINVRPAQIVEQIVQRAELEVAGKDGEMRIQLKPEHLGELQVKITSHNGTVSALFLAESHTVKALIEAGLPQLKQQLSQQGLHIQDVSVQVGNGSPQGSDSNHYPEQLAPIAALNAGVAVGENDASGWRTVPVVNPYYGWGSTVDFRA